MDLELFRWAEVRHGRVKILTTNISPHQEQIVEEIKKIVMEGGSQFVSLVDSDGKEQFVFGVTPMDSSVRVGHV